MNTRAWTDSRNFFESEFMYNVWQGVKVKTETHPRFGEAGTVYRTDRQDHPDKVVVQFDLDGSLESVDLIDLGAL